MNNEIETDPLIKITEDILIRGESDNGGWSRRQLQCLGTDFQNNSGWRQRIVGKMVRSSAVKRFISLKNAHLKKVENHSWFRKFEYKFLEFKNAYDEDFENTISELGKEGWELCGIIEYNQIFILKREIV